MSLYINDIIDPLALINEGRQLSKCPVHFVKVNCNNTTLATEWVWKNLVGRFSVQKNGIAFEDPSEASMFGLMHDRF